MNRAHKKITGSILPTAFMGMFFVITIVGNFLLIYIAGNGYNGTVTDNAYQKGLDYNNVINASKQQQKLGWQGDLQLVSNRGTAGYLRFCLHNSNGTPLAVDSAKAQLRHPVTDKYDQEIEFQKDNKCQVAKVAFAKSGRWQILLHAIIGTTSYYHHDTVIVE